MVIGHLKYSGAFGRLSYCTDSGEVVYLVCCVTLVHLTTVVFDLNIEGKICQYKLIVLT